MKESPRKTTVSLEDLLRLKRAEQPPVEFWDQFEQGLRTKRLAAIVEPRPWWAPFIRSAARLSRYQLPVGATAVLAITFLTVREYRTADLIQVYEPAGIEATAPASMAAVAKGSVTAADAAGARSVASVPMVLAEMPVRPVLSAEPRSEQASRASAMVGSVSHLAPVPSELSMATYIAENLAKNKPELDRVLDRPVEPLSQVNMPGESRRSRLLEGTAWLASAGSASDSSLRTSEQATRHLNERRLTESDVISRLDVGGDHLGVKF